MQHGVRVVTQARPLRIASDLSQFRPHVVGIYQILHLTTSGPTLIAPVRPPPGDACVAITRKPAAAITACMHEFGGPDKRSELVGDSRSGFPSWLGPPILHEPALWATATDSVRAPPARDAPAPHASSRPHAARRLQPLAVRARARHLSAARRARRMLHAAERRAPHAGHRRTPHSPRAARARVRVAPAHAAQALLARARARVSRRRRLVALSTLELRRTSMCSGVSKVTHWLVGRGLVAGGAQRRAERGAAAGGEVGPQLLGQLAAGGEACHIAGLQPAAAGGGRLLRDPHQLRQKARTAREGGNAVPRRPVRHHLSHTGRVQGSRLVGRTVVVASREEQVKTAHASALARLRASFSMYHVANVL